MVIVPLTSVLIVGSHRVLSLDPCCCFFYFNDICAVSRELDFILIADDTNVFFGYKNLIL